MSLPTPYYDADGITLYHGETEAILPELPAAGVGLVIADPPYCGVVDAAWDNQWPTEEAFLAWLDGVLAACGRALAANGSLYVFTSPQMLTRVDVGMRARFRVLASLVWDKANGRQGVAGTGIDVTALRTFWSSTTERIVFAEQYGADGAHVLADQAARDASGYWDADERCKAGIFGAYLRAEFERAGVTNKQVAALFPSRTGGLTGCVSNWLTGANIPTAEQYAAIRDFLNTKGDEYLRREYEELRREYEELRREYEELRRPFNLTKTDQWGEVWRFGPDRERVHPTQKPLALIAQMVRVSSRKGDCILDPFAGSGTTLVAAKAAGRRAIGIEREEAYCAAAVRRLAQGVLPF
jgi:site-specific DNA-methyltransferase (adenine-specific)